LSTIKIKKGLDLPIAGAPRLEIGAGPTVTRVALVADDYVGMKPTMAVAVGDRVRRGQLLFTDKKTEGVRYTAPAAGTVVEVNRGEKRRFESLVIAVEGDEAEQFRSWKAAELDTLSATDVEAELLASGLWTAIRVRPYGKVAVPGTRPRSIFVTAVDTHPLGFDPALVVASAKDDFVNGLKVLARLATPVRVCAKAGSAVPGAGIAGVEVHSFSGPHPAGLVGTHIHLLDPVGPGRQVWHLGAQDVIAIGRLFTTGQLSAERVVSLAGPGCKNPRLVKTVLGADLGELTKGELHDGEMRVISGSVLGGRTAAGTGAYLGRYHQQVSVLREGREREFLGWQGPGFDKFSTLKIYFGSVLGKKFPMTTTTNGSRRAMVPMGTYEKMMPLDILPTQLLRSLIVRDTDSAQALGCLELEEEDLALCTFVCPGKYEYGPILRDNLTRIEKEG
jgi:Na+-transporting NADH:ubiquinone oxidoreductase subunit A